MASASSDGTVKVWDASTASSQHTLQGHTMSVSKLEYVDAETLVSCSADGTMRAWSVATGAQKEELDGGSLPFPMTALRNRRWTSTVSPSSTTCCSSQKASRWWPSSVPHTSSPR